jgi:hypothetical protein
MRNFVTTDIANEFATRIIAATMMILMNEHYVCSYTSYK